jgi:hypothetical protein
MRPITASMVVFVCLAFPALLCADDKSPYVEQLAEFAGSPVAKWKVRFSQAKYFEHERVRHRHDFELRKDSSPAVAARGIDLLVKHVTPDGASEDRKWTVAKDGVQVPDPRLDGNGPPTLRFGYELTELIGPLAAGNHEIEIQLVHGLSFKGRDKPLRLPAIKFEVVRFDPARHLPKPEVQTHVFRSEFAQWKGGPDNGTAYWNATLQLYGDVPLVLVGYQAMVALMTGGRVLCPTGHQQLVPDIGWCWMPNGICATGLEEFAVVPGEEYKLCFYEIKEPGIYRFVLAGMPPESKTRDAKVYGSPFMVKKRGEIHPVEAK